VLAPIVANSSLAPVRFGTLATYVGGLSIPHWINDDLDKGWSGAPVGIKTGTHRTGKFWSMYSRFDLLGRLW
jgi:hypothetical protein